MKSRNIADSFNNAINGVIYAFKSQRNMKVHFAIAVIVLLLSLFFDLNKWEFLILLFSIALVFVTELLNTAIEAVVDLITEKHHRCAAIAKDVAAGAVLVSALNAIAVGYILFIYRANGIIRNVFYRVKHSPPYLTFVVLILIMMLTIVLKAYFKEGIPLRGGMPSGHSALAFGIATSISFLTENVLVAILAFLLAFLVAQSRVEGRIHDLYQVIAGAALGMAVSVLIFQLLE
ncbi:diacylglycerol kinase [Caldanaerobius polysaccharolyticus]|uniref:diacylglycerol kinase n=1 Tax=Caldanaerobius polysaccharolyticus TaxID=44256 RepID=UPI00047EB99A|nr:diacylglycerol kinase [Caldanaerobius polysaccharolyticus]